MLDSDFSVLVVNSFTAPTTVQSLRVTFAVDRLFHLTVGALTCILILLVLPRSVHADGFRNPFHDAAAIAQGNAFAAQADNASALFYNPAGMTQLPGMHTAAGMQFVSINTKFTGPNRKHHRQ